MNIKRLTVLSFTTILSIAILAGCGKSRDEELFGEEGGEGAGAKIDPATAATIAGSVAFEGAAPAPSPLDMSADAVCAGGGSSAEGAGDVVIKDGKLANVFVYVSKGLEGQSFEAPKETAALDQKGCRYHPHVAGIMVGQVIKISNSDATLHNVHPTPKKNKGFNIAQPNKGMVNEKKFDQEEVMIPFSCDVHGWMRSYVGVLTHPFFGVSGADGAFSLAGVPPGSYTITAWHEKFGQQEQQVTVGAKEAKNITFTFKAS
ncbi:MAG: carboxypeptidase regulatory-like domain-containing protein [bacterium]|nr:carboxypeptidase regulatory-like domain-containing protein [Candidatus Kapabacteria bacterium]